MGGADIVPGVSGGTMALITGIYEELIESIHNLKLNQLLVLKNQGISWFWKEINGSFLLPLFLGITSSILFLSSLMSYLLEHHTILLWSFFFGLITASIFLLFRDAKTKGIGQYLFLIFGFFVAWGITQLSPTGTSDSLLYLFICSMIAIIAMILPGISGAFIFILLGVYEEVLNTVKGVISVLLNFKWDEFKEIFSKVFAIGLGIIIGLKLFSRVLNWLFKHKRQQTMSLLVGFMLGVLPKIWPWKKIIIINGSEVGKNVSPFVYDGNPQIVLSVLLMCTGAFMLILMNRISLRK